MWKLFLTNIQLKSKDIDYSDYWLHTYLYLYNVSIYNKGIDNYINFSFDENIDNFNLIILPLKNNKLY